MRRILEKIYLKFFVASGFEYARYLKDKNRLHSQGDDCFISKSAGLPDPYLLSLGSNVWITDGCKLLGHDAAVIMVNVKEKSHLDCVGPIVIGDNCFLGNDVVVLPNTRIGSNTIIGAGSLVNKDVPGDSVWGGSPARHIATYQEYHEKMKRLSESFPWSPLLKRDGSYVFDPALEQKLRQARTEYFFK